VVGGIERNQLKYVRAKGLKANYVKQRLGVCEWWEIWKWTDMWWCGVRKPPVFMKSLRFVQTLLVGSATWTRPAW